MSVCVAGATGEIHGQRVSGCLVVAANEVHDITRGTSKRAPLHEPGAVPAVADALDPDQVPEWGPGFAAA